MEKFKYLPKEKISQLPKTAGVYAFKNEKEILYIGKAANIKERVKNHFSQSNYRDNLFINQTKKIGYIKTSSEFAEPSVHLTSHPASQGSTIEALILEANLIKKYQPKYNIVWKDSKNYFFIGITKEDFPQIFITHQPVEVLSSKYKVLRRKNIPTTKYKILNTKFVGPFVDGKALKQTLKILRKIFPFRSCNKIPKHPCLWYQLKRCPAPCLLKSAVAEQIPNLNNKIKREYQDNIKNIRKILEGKKTQVLKNLKKEMKTASKNQKFEKAAKIRDQIMALEKVLAHTRIFEGYVKPRSWQYFTVVLKKILRTKRKIFRIEAYDVSNIQGQKATGSMITFLRGKPDKNFYRRFKIKISGKPDDTAMLKEILTRRLKHKEWPFPDLILIDGGKPQLNIAVKSKSQNPNSKKIKIIALAKRKNELFIENQKKPILLKNLPREIFNLILQLRDEAHRFAKKYHLKLRENATLPSPSPARFTR